MKFSNLVIAAFLMNVTFSALAQDVEEFEILGIKLGMTKEQAEMNLKSQLPNAALDSTELYREAPGVTQSLAKLEYTYTNEGGTSWVSLYFLPLSGKVFSISRRENIGVRYKPETWTPFNTLQTAFEKKYGTPTFISKYDGRYVVFDKNKKLTKAKPCMEFVTGVGTFHQTDDRCGIELGYEWHQGENQEFIGFADGFNVALTDYAAANEEMKQITLKASEIEKQQRDQGSKNTAPKL